MASHLWVDKESHHFFYVAELQSVAQRMGVEQRKISYNNILWF